MTYMLVTYALMTCALTSLAPGLAFGESRGEQGAEGLKLKFQPGDKFYMISVVESRVSQVVDGNERVVSQTVRLENNFDIDGVEEDGNAWARYTYKRVTLKMKGPDIDVDYDSNETRIKVPPRALPQAMAIGEEIYIKLTPQGRVVQINGLRALVTSVKSKVPDRPGKELVMGGIENQFEEGQVRYDLEDRLAVFPSVHALIESEAGEPNASRSPAAWSSTEYQQIGEVNLVVERDFRLKEQRDGIAVVDVNVVSRPDVNTGINMFSGIKTRRDISGQGTGQILIEQATGRIVKSVITEDNVDNIKVFAQGPVLRTPKPPEPVYGHTVATFEMVRREIPSSGRKPDSSALKPRDANQPNR